MIFDDIQEATMNVVNKNTTRKIIHEVMRDLSDAVKHTLGPAGKTTLLHDPNGITSLYPSKDGHRIIFNSHFDDYYYEAVYLIIRDVSNATNMTIGDGTTSCVVILNKFFNDVDKLFKIARGEIADEFKIFPQDVINAAKYLSPAGLTNVLDAIKDVLKDFLYKKGYIVRLDELPIEERKKIVRRVGTIAANNDEVIGDEVGKLYDGVVENMDELYVNIVPNEGGDTTVISDIGFEAPIGGINRIYSNQSDGASCILNSPRFLLVEGPLLDGDLSFLEPIVRKVCVVRGESLVIIADEYSNVVSEWLYRLAAGGAKFEYNGKSVILEKLNILPIMHSSNFELGRDRLEDLACALGGQIQICQSNRLEMIPDTDYDIDMILGEAEKIMSTTHLTRIFGGKGSKEVIKARIDSLEELLRSRIMQDSEKVQSTLAVYKERIGMLKSNMVSIKVGGLTYKERQYKCLVVEDAVYAIKSCIRNGFTLAGQTSLFHLIYCHRDELVKTISEKIIKENRNVIYGQNRHTNLETIIAMLLDIVMVTFKVAYKEALSNAYLDPNTCENIDRRVFFEDPSYIPNKQAEVYNLMTDEFESMYNSIDSKLTLNPDCSLIVAGNTDYEILNAVIGVSNLFFMADNIQSIFVPVRNKDTKGELTNELLDTRPKESIVKV